MTAGEASDIDDVVRVDPHPLEGWAVSDRRDDESAVVLEADEAAIKQMIDARR